MGEQLETVVRQAAEHRCECWGGHDHGSVLCHRRYQSFLYERPAHGQREGRLRRVMLGRVVRRPGATGDAPADHRLLCEVCAPS